MILAPPPPPKKKKKKNKKKQKKKKKKIKKNKKNKKNPPPPKKKINHNKTKQRQENAKIVHNIIYHPCSIYNTGLVWLKQTISPRILKEVKTGLVRPLALLFNYSLQIKKISNHGKFHMLHLFMRVKIVLMMALTNHGDFHMLHLFK